MLQAAAAALRRASRSLDLDRRRLQQLYAEERERAAGARGHAAAVRAEQLADRNRARLQARPEASRGGPVMFLSRVVSRGGRGRRTSRRS